MADRRPAIDALAASIALLLQFLEAPLWLRVPAGFLMVFLLPGHAVLLAARWRQEGLLRLPIVVATSLAATIACGLVLNLLPFGLTAGSWSVAVWLVVVLSALVAIRVPRGHGAVQRTAVTWTAALKGVVAVALVAATVVVSVQSQRSADERSTFTEFWVSPGSAQEQVISLASHEATEVDYVLKVSVRDGAPIERSVQLAPGQRWSMPVTVSGGGAGPALRADLYRDGGTTPYRSLVIEEVTSS